MDDAAFGLSESHRILYTAGIRYVLRVDSPCLQTQTTFTTESLPDFLLQHLAKATRKPKTLWTYAQLGDDLSGASQPYRSQLLKNLVSFLAWPRGSVGFWPFALDKAPFQSSGYDLFQFGLRELQPSGVVVFGVNDLLSIGDYLDSERLESFFGCRFCLLPDMETLAGLSSLEFEDTAAVLHSFWQTL